MFTWKSHAGLKFHFGQNDQYEITVLSFISPQFMWTQVKSWLNTEVRFSTEMKSHTGLSSFRLSCERTLRQRLAVYFKLDALFLGQKYVKGLRVSKNIEEIKCSVPWGEIEAKNYLQRQPWTESSFHVE